VPAGLPEKPRRWRTPDAPNDHQEWGAPGAVGGRGDNILMHDFGENEAFFQRVLLIYNPLSWFSRPRAPLSYNGRPCSGCTASSSWPRSSSFGRKAVPCSAWRGSIPFQTSSGRHFSGFIS